MAHGKFDVKRSFILYYSMDRQITDYQRKHGHSVLSEWKITIIIQYIYFNCKKCWLRTTKK